MGVTALETRRADNFGGTARSKNTRRLFVPPTAMTFITGTWAAALASNVLSMNKTAADETSTVYIPFQSALVSDAMIEGNKVAVDRGVRPIGVELMWSVGTADLQTAPTLKIFKDIYADDGTLNTASEVTTTGSGLVVGQDEQRGSAVIAERDRFFLSSGVGVHAEATLDAAATSVIKVFGAIWHLEMVEE